MEFPFIAVGVSGDRFPNPYRNIHFGARDLVITGKRMVKNTVNSETSNQINFQRFRSVSESEGQIWHPQYVEIGQKIKLITKGIFRYKYDLKITRF